MTCSHLQAVELEQGLALLGHGSPSVNLGVFTPTSWGDPVQSTRKPLPVPHCLLSWFQGCLLSGSAGGSSGVQFNLPAGLLRGHGGEQPPVGLRGPVGLWPGACACHVGSSQPIGWPSLAPPGAWLMKAAPSRASGGPPRACPQWCLREKERTPGQCWEGRERFNQEALCTCDSGSQASGTCEEPPASSPCSVLHTPAHPAVKNVGGAAWKNS